MSGLQEYIVLLQRFLDSRITTKELQEAYFERFKNEGRLDEKRFLILDKLFADLDSFTEDKILLAEAPEYYLDETELREKVRTALAHLG